MWGAHLLLAHINKRFQDPALHAGQYFHFNLHFRYGCEVQVDGDVELNVKK